MSSDSRMSLVSWSNASIPTHKLHSTESFAEISQSRTTRRVLIGVTLVPCWPTMNPRTNACSAGWKHSLSSTHSFRGANTRIVQKRFHSRRSLDHGIPTRGCQTSSSTTSLSSPSSTTSLSSPSSTTPPSSPFSTTPPSWFDIPVPSRQEFTAQETGYG
jgi:hypothetical protein